MSVPAVSGTSVVCLQSDNQVFKCDKISFTVL